VVSSCSWGKHVVLSAESSLRFCNENQLKSNKEYGDSLYDFLALMRTDQEKARYIFLGRCTTTRKVTRIEWYNGKMKIKMV
jgi:DNA-directed RNA polymerase-5 subunit 1